MLPCWFINPTAAGLCHPALFLKQSLIWNLSVAVRLSYPPILACNRSSLNTSLCLVLLTLLLQTRCPMRLDVVYRGKTRQDDLLKLRLFV